MVGTTLARKWSSALSVLVTDTVREVEPFAQMSTSDHDPSHTLTAIHLMDTHYHTWMVATLILAACTFIILIRSLCDKESRKFWNSQQWAGPQNRLFPRTRAGIDAIRHTCEVVGKGYERVRRHPEYIDCIHVVVELTSNHSFRKTESHSFCPSLVTILW
jgi:hypothetical protein